MFFQSIKSKQKNPIIAVKTKTENKKFKETNPSGKEFFLLIKRRPSRFYEEN
jgi:hypothetical protein